MIYNKYAREDSNLEPTDYESGALTVELRAQSVTLQVFTLLLHLLWVCTLHPLQHLLYRMHFSKGTRPNATSGFTTLPNTLLKR